MNNNIHNPDVLSCLANLSSDEVFTPPEIANAMLDLLPQELFSDPSVTFLDPCCKSGVFLREIAKRLNKGLEAHLPNREERLEHIFRNQLFGIAITELTTLLARRGVYCSKYPNGPYSVVRFDNADGNIRYKHITHTWRGGKCVFCGASQAAYGEQARKEGLESHAYEFIHANNPNNLFPMNFDVIIGNPPYQLDDGGNGASAKPLYHLFVEQTMKLKPKYLSMVIPARWYAGGKGLDDFRATMLGQKHIRKLVDVTNSADCFPGVNIAGGICYFLWDNTYSGDCAVVNIKEGECTSENIRSLDEFDYFVRSNLALTIIRKVLASKDKLMNKVVYSRNYFNLPTTVSGSNEFGINTIKILTSKGFIYLHKNTVTDKESILDKYKVIITYAMSGGNKPTSEGNYQILSSLRILNPKEACTETYLILDVFEKKQEAENLVSFMSSKFARFLLLQALSSIHITKDKFCFVPYVGFEKPWTDEMLYSKYSLKSEEIDYIEKLIKPMEIGG